MSWLVRAMLLWPHRLLDGLPFPDLCHGYLDHGHRARHDRDLGL
jgi:hypothetical protein